MAGLWVGGGFGADAEELAEEAEAELGPGFGFGEAEPEDDEEDDECVEGDDGDADDVHCGHGNEWMLAGWEGIRVVMGVTPK